MVSLAVVSFRRKDRSARFAIRRVRTRHSPHRTHSARMPNAHTVTFSATAVTPVRYAIQRRRKKSQGTIGPRSKARSEICIPRIPARSHHIRCKEHCKYRRARPRTCRYRHVRRQPRDRPVARLRYRRYAAKLCRKKAIMAHAKHSVCDVSY